VVAEEAGYARAVQAGRDAAGGDASVGRRPGRVIVALAWAGDLAFACTAVPWPSAPTCSTRPRSSWGSCCSSCPRGVVAALAIAIARTARGDEVVVSTCSCSRARWPGRVRWLLYGALGVCLAITVATASANPFGVLVPMFPLGLIGLWGARHGVFPRAGLRGPLASAGAAGVPDRRARAGEERR